MYKPYFWASLLCLPTFVFATEIPSYPTDDPSSANLAKYYQALSDYYQEQADLYAQKAKNELLVAQKKQNLPPVAIKNDKPFTGSNAGLGFIMNTGNTNSQNFNGNALMSYTPNEASTTTWNTTYQNNHDGNKGQLSDNFYTDLNSAFNFNAKNGIYGDLNFTRNTFSGYNYQVNESIGYNRVIFDNNTFSLTGQIGPGLQQSSVPSPGSFQNQVVGYGKLFSVYNFTDQTNWRETYTVVSSSSNTQSTLDSAISMVLAYPFALQLDYLINYDTNPQPGKVNFNTATTLSIVYNFQ